MVFSPVVATGKDYERKWNLLSETRQARRGLNRVRPILALTTRLDLGPRAFGVLLKDDDKIVDGFAGDRDAKVRVSVASNPILPKELREKLVTDKSVEVRKALAKNVSLSKRELDQLAEDWDTDVQWRIAEHFNTNGRTLYKLYRRSDSALLRSELMRRGKSENVPELKYLNVKRFITINFLLGIPLIILLYLDVVPSLNSVFQPFEEILLFGFPVNGLFTAACHFFWRSEKIE